MTDQTTRVEPKLAGPELGRRLREIRLPSGDGREVGTGQYRQRRNLVVVFHHGGDCAICGEYLMALAERVPDLADEETVALAVGVEDQAEASVLWDRLGRRLACLADPSGLAAEAEGLGTPAVIVADRFGQIWAGWAGGSEHALPSPDDVLDWVRFVELQCPE